MYFTGIIIAASTFLAIGVWHPIVIKTEYYWGTRPWIVYLIVGLALDCISHCGVGLHRGRPVYRECYPFVYRRCVWRLCLVGHR